MIRIKWLVIIFALTLTSCTTFRSEDNEKAQFHLKIGTTHLMNAEYPQALNELLMAEKLDDEDPIIQNNLGLAYYFRGQVQLAEVHLKKSIRLKPDYTDAKNNLGRVMIETGKIQESIPYLESAANDLTYINPEKPVMNLGIAFFKLEKYDKSIEQLQKSLNYKRDNCLAYSFLGRNYYELKDFSKATDTLDKAIGYCKKSQFDEPNYYSALSYYQLGNVEIAKSRLDEIIKMYPFGTYADKAKSMLEVIQK